MTLGNLAYQRTPLPTLIRLPAVVVSLFALVLALASPASAQTRTIGDPRGDAAADHDLLSVTYTNGRSFSATAKVRKLGQVGTFWFWVYDNVGGYSEYATVERRSSGRVVVSWWEWGDFTEKTPCSGISGTWSIRQSAVTVTVPRACVQEKSTDRFHASMFGARGGADQTRWATVGRG